MARRPEFYFDEKTGYYRKRVKLQSGAYKDVRAKSKEELRAKLYDLETAQRMGVILDDKTTVAQLLAQWYTNRKDGLSYSRRRDYVNAINNHICLIIGGYRLRSVKPEDCQRVMAALAGKSNSLQTKVLGVMNMGFDCAVENGLIFRSPCAKIKAGGVPTEEKVPLTPEQCAALEGHPRLSLRADRPLHRPTARGDLWPALERLGSQCRRPPPHRKQRGAL